MKKISLIVVIIFASLLSGCDTISFKNNDKKQIEEAKVAAIEEIKNHNLALDHADAAKLALEAGTDIDMLGMENCEFRLRDALKPILEYYDYILFDCPPALGYLTINALTAADSVIVPLQCEFFALEGIQQLVDTITVVQEKWNPDLKILGVLLTMYDKRYGLTRDVDDNVRETFGDLVFKTVVPRNVRVSEAPSHGKPAMFYDFKSPGAQAYLRVATEVVQKTEGIQ